MMWPTNTRDSLALAGAILWDVARRRAAAWLAAVAGALFIVGCSSSGGASSPPAAPSLTQGDAARAILGALCANLDACFPADFAAAYPGGESECVDRALAKVSTPTAPASCSRVELDACVGDENAMACAPSAASTRLAPSCEACDR